MTKQNRQNRFEKILYFSALVYAEFYLLPCVFRHMIRTDKLIDIPQWCALILAFAALVYLFTVKLPTFRNQEEKERFLNCFGSYEQIHVVYIFFWYILSVALYQYRFGETLFLDNDLWMFISGLVAFLFFRSPSIQAAKRQNGRQNTFYTVWLSLLSCFGLADLELFQKYNVRASRYLVAAMLASAAFISCWNQLENREMLLRIAAGILLSAAVGLCCHQLREETLLLL